MNEATTLPPANSLAQGKTISIAEFLDQHWEVLRLDPGESRMQVRERVKSRVREGVHRDRLLFRPVAGRYQRHQFLRWAMRQWPEQLAGLSQLPELWIAAAMSGRTTVAIRPQGIVGVMPAADRIQALTLANQELTKKVADLTEANARMVEQRADAEAFARLRERNAQNARQRKRHPDGG